MQEKLPRLRSSAGQILVEYAVVTAILVAVGMIGAKVLQDSGNKRHSDSMSVASDIVPCGADLSGAQCY